MQDKALTSNILRTAIIFEIPLLIPCLIRCILLNDFSIFSLPYFSSIVAACLFSVLLFILNIIFYFTAYRFRIKSFIIFIEQIVQPLAGVLNRRDAAIVSILAGLGEEFFFRGFLLPIFGLYISSFLFSFLHFFYDYKRFILLIIVYFLIGLLFGIVFNTYHNIWQVALFHALYDFLALLFFNSAFKDRVKIYAERSFS